MTKTYTFLLNHDERVNVSDVGYKPPLGVMPEKLWKECRVWDLIGGLSRARDARSYGPESLEKHGVWLDELRRLLNEVLYPC